jgi:hypothetical protein
MRDSTPERGKTIMQNYITFVLVAGLGVAVLGVGLLGCSTFQKKEGARTAGQVMDDKETTKRVEKALKEEPVYKFTDVDVTTYEGVVQLSGFVLSEEQKQRAATVAERVSGVSQLVNNITVKPKALTPTGRTNEAPSTQNQQNQTTPK